MQIDIVSDTVCPWCFIGKRRIERAMAMRPDVKFEVFWRPYRLDPTMPREGVDRRAYLKAKFGDCPRSSAMGDAIRSEGAGEGIEFAFDKIAKTPNTLDFTSSGPLGRRCRRAGRHGRAAVPGLFHRRPGRRRSCRACRHRRRSRNGRRSRCDASRRRRGPAEPVEREAGIANEMGISGVPTFIFDSKFMISGAREPELLVRVIDKALEAASGSAP